MDTRTKVLLGRGIVKFMIATEITDSNSVLILANLVSVSHGHQLGLTRSCSNSDYIRPGAKI